MKQNAAYILISARYLGCPWKCEPFTRLSLTERTRKPARAPLPAPWAPVPAPWVPVPAPWVGVSGPGSQPGTPAPPPSTRGERRAAGGGAGRRKRARRCQLRRKFPAGLAVTLGPRRRGRRGGGLGDSAPPPGPGLRAAGSRRGRGGGRGGPRAPEPRAQGRPADMSLVAEAFVSQIAGSARGPGPRGRRGWRGPAAGSSVRFRAAVAPGLAA